MAFGDELHNHQALQAVKAGGNSFDHESNEIPPMPPLESFLQPAAQQSAHHATLPSMPHPILPPQQTYEFPALTTQAQAQKSAMEHQRGQMEERMRSMDREVRYIQENAHLHAQLQVAQQPTPQHSIVPSGLVTQALNSAVHQGPDMLCRVMPVAGAVVGAYVLVRLGLAAGGKEKFATAGVAGAIGLLFGGWAGWRISPCGVPVPGLGTALVSAMGNSGPGTK